MEDNRFILDFKLGCNFKEPIDDGGAQMTRDLNLALHHISKLVFELIRLQVSKLLASVALEEFCLLICKEWASCL